MDVVFKFEMDDDYPIRENGILCNMKEYRYTFWDSQLKLLPKFIDCKAIDLLMLSLAVYGADRMIMRKSAGDGWKRNIHIHLPVLNLQVMNDQKRHIKSILDFLSGDEWTLSFRSRELTEEEKEYIEIVERGKQLRINVKRICMFSGGLDSFIGAIDSLVEDSQEIIFVSHYGGGKGVREYQQLLQAELERKFTISGNRFFSYYAAPPDGKEDTMRSRSFMFFSHAIALASCFEEEIKLIVPENGYISLNIPLTFSRLGSSSTRTTHPHYMTMLQKLINGLGLSIKIINPYQFKTKGEMVIECKNQEFLRGSISNTMSCSHPDLGRMRGESDTKHCGTCLPCVIRRAAMLKAGYNDDATYYDSEFKKGSTAKTNLNSYLLGLQKYDAERAFLSIQMSGPLTEKLDEYESVYKSGIEEMRTFLEQYNESD